MSQSFYKLSATLSGHEQDVKSVAVLNNDTVATCSRDGSVRLWKKGHNNLWQDAVVYQSDEFVNSLCYDNTSGLLFCGGQNCLINSVSPLLGDVGQDSEFVLIGHENNVCVLNSSQGYVLSGSWDTTAKVWFQGALKHELKGHTASVWDVKMLPEVGFYMTASADGTIKLWEGEKVLKTFTGLHTDVIRHIDIDASGEKFASCSNDGTVKINDMEGKTLKTLVGHESFVYSVKFAPNGEVISCGEDRTVRIWKADGTVKQVIRVPAVSTWDLDILPNGDILIGCSDSFARIFTCDEKRVAPQKEQELLAKMIEDTAINSQAMGFDESKLSPKEILSSPGKEGQVVVVKSPSGVNEAYQCSQRKWVKVGDVVGSAGNDQKKEFEGKMYDYVFDVDVTEGLPPLKLPFNANDNVYQAADDFLSRNELPASYKEEVVRFLISNTTGISLEQQQEAGKAQPIQPTNVSMSVLPVTSYQELRSFSPDSIFNGIVKLNANEKTFDDEDLAAIGAALHDVEGNIDLLYAQASIMRSSWSNKTPAYDIMRLIVRFLPQADTISDFIEEGLGSKSPQLEMLTIRTLANCFTNPDWGCELMSKSSVYDSVFQTIEFEQPNGTKKNNLAIAISTLILNYSVMIVRDGNMDILPAVADALNNKFGPSQLLSESEEGAYRLIVAYGNLATVEPSLLQFAKSIAWIRQVNAKYGMVARFDHVLKDLSIH